MTRPTRPDTDEGFRADVALSKRLDTYKTAFVGLAQAARGRVDNWVNTITGLGGTRDRTTGMGVASFTPLTWWELDALYHGEDLPAIIVDRLPTDALSGGFSFGNPELDHVSARWRLPDLVLEARIWSRLYGVGGILIGTGLETGPMNSPLRLAEIRKGSLQYLMPLDREDITIAEYDQVTHSPTFGDPRMYRVGDQDVHPSRVLLLPGARTSARQRLRNGGWDLSVLQRPYNVLRDTEQSWRSVMNLLSDLSQAVFAIQGLSSMIANGQKDIVMDRMQITDMARSVARAVVIDAESERFEHVGAQNITGVDPLLVRVFTRLAAAADMPLTLLMGTSPAGLNATGQSDLSIWYTKCEGERKLLQGAVHYLGAVVARDAGLPAPEGVDWPELGTLNDLERADLDLKRAQAATAWIGAQVTSADEERRVLAGESREDVIREVDAQALALATEGAPVAVEDDADPDIAVAAGESWIDSHDGHRLKVTAVAAGSVYVQDLDGPNPMAQFRWSKSYFLERCMPAPSTEPGAEG